MEATLYAINRAKKKCYGLGITNLDHTKVTESTIDDYINLLHRNLFTPMINKPTRTTATFSTILDHILTNDSSSAFLPGILDEIITDHLPVFVLVDKLIQKNIENVTYRRGLKMFDPTKFSEDLQQVLCPYLTTSIDKANLDDTLTNFVNDIKCTVEKHAPMRKLSRRKSKLIAKSWITKEILIFIINKQRLYTTFYRFSNKFKKLQYKKYANLLTRVITLPKQLCYRHTVCFVKTAVIHNKLGQELEIKSQPVNLKTTLQSLR